MTLTPPPGPRSAATSRRLSAIALMMSLAACGGGGSDSSSPAPPPPPPPPPPSSGPFAISGKAVFESVPPSTAGTGLNYAAATDKPIRGATVQLLDAASAVLATTTTDTAGNYSVTLPTSQAVTIRVRAEIKRTGSPSGDRDLTVLDNTSGNAIYALDSAAFTPTTAAVTQNVRAGSGWGGTSYTTTRAAGPFSLLDVVYEAQAKVASVAPTVTLPPLKVFWSVNNRPVDGDRTLGQIGTSFFTSSQALGRALYVLGAADTDTDEYDTHVIAHEFGHYLQSALSRDDSVGGSHGSGDKLDARVAFSEGWGNSWSGIVFGNPVYTDTRGARQSLGFNIDVSVAATGTDQGWFSETTAQYLIWKTNQTTGFGPVYTALTTFPSSPAFSSLYSFAAAVKANPAVTATTITSLFATQQVVAQDAFGAGETNNNGGVVGALPIYKPHTAGLGVAQNYCVTTSADSTNDDNKLGEFVYIRFPVTGGSHTLTVVKTSPAGTAVTDPDFRLLKLDGTSVYATSPSTSGSTPPSVNDTETLTVTLPSGTHTIALSDAKLVSPQTSCFNFTVN